MSMETTASVKSMQKQKVTLDPKAIGKLAGTLVVISAVVALLLALVNHVTEPIITQMQEEKTAAAMRQVLEADDYQPVETSMVGVSAMYRAMSGDKQIGYVAEVTGNGFGGMISMVVGVDQTGAVTGVAITKASETPNIGSKVVGDQSVLDRFIGMSHASGEITVNSGVNVFDGVSGATVSSKGVTSGVNAALAAVAAMEG